jgi:hypothetical protein
MAMPARRTVVLFALALVIGLTSGAAMPAAAQSPAAAYVVLGGAGAVARAVVLAGTTGIVPQCPAIVVNGASQAMSVRAQPDTNFPVLVCEYVLPAGATSAAITGQALPLPPTALNAIAVFGDTGCRLKADKISAAQAARDSEELDEEGKFQDCNDPSDWPFAPMSAVIAKAKPDLVVHVGDYHYRESPCPSGDQGCQGSPYGDNWVTWAADFFTPAAPLLQAAPWIVTRGNHEICKRAGVGYARLLDPTPAGSQIPPTCVDLIEQYTVTVGGHAFIVLDSSDAPDECPKSGCDSAPYAKQFEAMQPVAATWLVTHRPIWGFTNSKDKSGKRKLGRRNMTLQAALAQWNGVPPPGIELVLSGHIHLWEALSFADKGSPQFVLGSGSTELAHKITEKLKGAKIGGRTVAAATTDHRFGYTMFLPSKRGGHWDATFYDTGGKAKIACKVEATKATCH